MIYSFSPFGYEGSLVAVEVDLRRGIPATDIVGLADGAIKESRERMISAIRNSGLEYPNERVLISLSPAELKKEGAGFDLPIALAVMSAKEDYPRSQDAKVLVMGELELSGKVRSVRGVYPALTYAQSVGIKYAIVPKGGEKIYPQGIKVIEVEDLNEALRVLSGIDEYEVEGDGEYDEEWFGTKPEDNKLKVEFTDVPKENSLDSIKGMNGLKFAMSVAVAGRHNLLVWGKSGCGKTMVLQRMPEIMPKLLPDEQKITTRIWSLAGLLKGKEGYLTTRPFRMPHQTASIEGLCGGGINCRAGEISLAHNGVLFLDEAPEFRSSVLQMLRVPLESHQITLCRAGRSTTFPAHFQLVMSAIPCPCGNYGSKDKVCLCSLKSLELYWKKFSAPLLDIVGIRFDCNQEDVWKEVTVEEMREMIKRAWETQYTRQGKLNEDLTSQEVDNLKIDPEAIDALEKANSHFCYSPRAVTRLIKIARTYADMIGYETITENAMEMAISLRDRIEVINV